METRVADRVIAVFLLGLLAFSPPLLALVRHDITIFGVPLLFAWLFGVWGALIAGIAWVSQDAGGEDEESRPDEPLGREEEP